MLRRFCVGFITSALFLVGARALVYADLLRLTNGHVVEGIVVAENEETLTVQIFAEAFMVFQRAEIASIDYTSGDANERLQTVWEQEREAKRKELAARQRFEAEQAANGLVKYKDTWITPEEKLKKTESGRRAGVQQFVRSHENRHGAVTSRVTGLRSSFAQQLLSKGQWRARQSEHFTVYYRRQEDGAAVSERAEYYFEKIKYDLDCEQTFRWNEVCEVFLVETEEEWRGCLEHMGGKPELVGGFYLPQTVEIFIWAKSKTFVERIFPHELTHLVLDNYVGTQNLPLWLNEGIANYEAGVFGSEGNLLYEKVRASKHILLEELVLMDQYPREEVKRQLFYQEASTLVEYFIVQHGRESFGKLITTVVQGEPFFEAITKVYRRQYRSLDAFRRKWIAYIIG